MTGVDFSALTTNDPYKPLTKRIKSHAAAIPRAASRCATRAAARKKLYRMVDFKQNRMNDTATVLTVEYDPYRTAFIALVEYAKDKKKVYILAPHGLKVGDKLLTAASAPFTVPATACASRTFRWPASV
jgi:large subunit ribosomal protein L2